MKLQSGFRIFLPILVLALAVLTACAQDTETPAPQGLLPTVSLVEPARPLTAAELETIDEFVAQQQNIEAEREQFYQEFDNWREGLTACHPIAAREALREFAASFGSITDSARNLLRTSSTRELADMLITAADAEGAAFRELRDRWQPGNISLLEAVELQRAEAGRAQNAVVDQSLRLKEEFEEGPTATEVKEMEEFSATFDEIADTWDDFHDDYSALAKRERRLTDAEILAGYVELIGQFKMIVSSIEELTPTEINEELVETLQDAAEAELDALEYLVWTLSEPMESGDSNTSGPSQATSTTAMTAGSFQEPVKAPENGTGQNSLATQAPTPAPPAEPAKDPAIGTDEQVPATPPEPQPTQGTPAAPEAQTSHMPGETNAMELSPREELAAVIKASEDALKDVEQSIEEIVNDKSTEYLEDLKNFDSEFRDFLGEWNRFYSGFNYWRATDGECDRVGVAQELASFSQQAGGLARKVQDLPQSGYLVPVYALVVEASEREGGAFRALANSWTPFAVDAFKALEDERVNATRLRRQASIALEELRTRQ